MKKILPIRLQKDINTYLDVGYKCSILFAQENYKSWYNTHFINIYTYLSSNNTIKVTYEGSAYPKCYYYEALNIEPLPFCFINKDIVSYIKEMIDNGKYVNIGLDEFYIKDKSSYNTMHFYHVSLFYGYDSDEQVLYTIGFNKDRYFEYISMSFSEVKEAFNGSLSKSDEKLNMAGELLSVNSLLSTLTYKPNEFRNSLEGYIYSKRYDANVGTWYDDKYNNVIRFGISVYDALIQSYKDINVQPIEYRAFHLIAEHKRELLKKIQYYIDLSKINERQIISLSKLMSEYNENIVKVSEIMRLRYLKFSKQKNINISYIIEKLEYIKEREKEILLQIYNILE